MSFQELQTNIYRLHAEKNYTEALTLLDREGENFPAQAGTTFYWKMCFNCLLGQLDQAIGNFEDALNRGYWLGEPLLRGDPDLKPLQGSEKFESLLQRSRQCAEEMAEKVGSVRVYLEPEKPTDTLLVALHGNNNSAQNSVDYWRPAAENGWAVLLPSSSQFTSPTTAVWNDEEKASSEIRRHFTEVVKPSQQIVIGGFSMGGRTALSIALKELIPVKGIIAVGAAIGDGIERWLPYMENAKQRQMRVVLIVGDQDIYLIEPTKQLAEAFEKAGVECRLRVYPGLDHVFPPDFSTTLIDDLAWITLDR